MAILDIFKRKKKAKKKTEKKTKEAKPLSVKPSKKEKRPAAAQKPKKASELGYRVLKEPQVTEKATDLVQKNQYIFKVFPRANKAEVKKAVQDAYGVNVESVRMISLPRKKRRLGRIEGWQSGTKKAVVKVKEGQKIEILPR